MSNEARGGLNIPRRPAGMGQAQESAIHNRWSITDGVTEYLTMKIGMSLPSEPNFNCPELALDDLTTPDTKEYTEHYLQRTAWFGYLTEKKAEHDAHVIEIEAEMQDIEANIRERLRQTQSRTTGRGIKKDPPVAEMADKIHTDPRWVELKIELVKHSQVIVRMNAQIKKLEAAIKLTSRQVELRRQEFDNTNRGSSIGGHSGPPRGMRSPSGEM